MFNKKDLSNVKTIFLSPLFWKYSTITLSEIFCVFVISNILFSTDPWFTNLYKTPYVIFLLLFLFLYYVMEIFKQRENLQKVKI